MAEKAANQLNAYGGFGAHGLDFGDEGGPGAAAAGENGRKAMNTKALKGFALPADPKIRV